MAYDPKDLPQSLANLFNLRQQGEPTLSQMLSGLAFPSPPVIRDRWFRNETIKLDGYTFERCRFDTCSLVTEMATFTFKSCFISPDCGLYLVGPALKVGRLLMHTLRVKGRITTVAGEEALYAPINPDGTFSLE